jgi:hypothetical protein
MQGYQNNIRCHMVSLPCPIGAPVKAREEVGSDLMLRTWVVIEIESTLGKGYQNLVCSEISADSLSWRPQIAWDLI